VLEEKLRDTALLKEAIANQRNRYAK